MLLVSGDIDEEFGLFPETVFRKKKEKADFSRQVLGMVSKNKFQSAISSKN